ncbi:MAG: DUF3795 domain-containing protein [Oscillospiraceae bacterium]|nr:DUF3795 domain-containing protein [Oscillospiraceae bacterium]
MDKHKLAACGIDCNECGHYMLAMKHDLKSAEYLVEYFRDGGWIGKNDGAEAVLRKVPMCKGCWSDFVTCNANDCLLRPCCVEKKINNCGECGDFPCKRCTDFMTDGLEHHKKAMEHLMSIHKTIFDK